MHYFVTGLSLFILVHFFPVFAATLRESLINKFGATAYRIGFGTIVAASLALVIYGWHRTDPMWVYNPPLWAFHIGPTLVLLGTILVLAHFMPARITASVPAPRMLGILFWAGAHLLMNGDSRALVLFGAVTLWCLIAIWGARPEKRAPVSPTMPSLLGDIKLVVIAAAIYVSLLMLHELVIGVSPLPTLG